MMPKNLLQVLSAALLIVSLFLVSCSTTFYDCTDPLGCLKISPSGAVVIGAILATSGEQRPVGIASLLNVKKVVADKEFLLGHQIQLITYGTDCTAASAQLAATEFATNTDLSAVVGPTCSSESEAAGPILMNAGIPLFGPVLDPTAAGELTKQVLDAIQQVAVLMPDKTLYLPRQALLIILNLSR